MHTYMITRGIKNEIDTFINDLQGKFLPYRWWGKDGKPIDTNVRLAVRPIQLWEIVYPEEHYDLVNNTLFGDSDGITQHKKHNKFIKLIRKVLGVKPMKPYAKDKILPVQRHHMECVAIGYKEDRKENYDGEEIEML